MMATGSCLSIILHSILLALLHGCLNLPFGLVTSSFSSHMLLPLQYGLLIAGTLSGRDWGHYSVFVSVKFVKSHNTIDTQMPCIQAVPMSISVTYS